MNRVKTHGTVYTPTWIVNQILDLGNYSNGIYNKKVLEPGCGNGAFLSVIVERLILDAKKNGIEDQYIGQLLSEQVYGFDIDAAAIQKATNRLDAICSKHGVAPPDWHHITVSSLLKIEKIEDYEGQFDFVFGNPPYVRIQNLEEDDRRFINKHCICCQNGSTDLYIAFMELGFKFLNPDGVLGFITPNSFMSSNTGREVRRLLGPHVSHLVDFSGHQVFENVTTYAVITILTAANNPVPAKLYRGTETAIRPAGHLPAFGLDNWTPKEHPIVERIEQIKSRGRPLGEITKIHTGLATLKDDLFICHNPTFNAGIARVQLNDSVFEIEAAILKRIIKASTWKGQDQKQFIIFPYKLVNGKHTIIPEDEMTERYPLALEYFRSVRQKLDQREKGNAEKLSKLPAWYAFGRSQGLDTSFGIKILTAGLNKRPNFIICNDQNTTYYSGYSIHCSFDPRTIIDHLNSEDMEFYIYHTSRDYRGGYKSYAKAFIKDFGVQL